MKSSIKNKEINVSIRKKIIGNYFNEIANEKIVTNRNFWKIIKPRLTNKVHLFRKCRYYAHSGQKYNL